jgi:glutamine amidotransferase
MKDKMTNNIKVAIIDYHMSNLYSVKNACDYIGVNAVITSDKEELLKADAVMLPGVGAFRDAITNLEELDLISPIKDFVSSGKPFMGICLGLQLLFSESEEFGQAKGLGFIPGEVKKFDYTNGVKVPHVGWNSIYCPEGNKEAWERSPLKVVKENEYMYFVHSYYVEPQDPKNI